MPITTKLSVYSILVATMKNQSMHLLINVAGSDREKDIETEALLDSGAGGIFMSHEFVRQGRLKLIPL